MKIESLLELYIGQLQDLYDAERQIIKAMPIMIEASTSDDLQDALEEHLEISQEQAARLEKIFEKLGEDPTGQKCKGMEGLINEGIEELNKETPKDVKDAAIIAAAQRVEHYEIAGYGTAYRYATLLNHPESAELLQRTLEEEREADRTLDEIAEQINLQAEQSDDPPNDAQVSKGEEKSEGGRAA